MTRIISINPVCPDPSIVSDAADIIKRGGIVAFPTDTFYGLAVDPFNLKAVKRLYRIKNRSPLKPLLLLINNFSMLERLIANMTSRTKKVINEFWPGSLTLVLQRKNNLADHLVSGKETIAVRFPDAPVPIKIIRKAGFPLTASSANISGKPPALLASEVDQYFRNDLDLILDGGPCRPIPSTILDLSGSQPAILREGKISYGTLEQFFSQLKQKSPHL